ncbi:ubiquitin specific protease 2 [Plasmodium falciparum RAJ116]|uniref:Ubiquitin specific protease 2 n=1 Tax=Plasmodium falciparum RAJ116 TaxID=580058 RepID=A0A0L0CZN2_PLAFA|nr:ubiquitin specific protease 2 [Plasmodium falciparum RAJ116]
MKKKLDDIDVKQGDLKSNNHENKNDVEDNMEMDETNNNSMDPQQRCNLISVFNKQKNHKNNISNNNNKKDDDDDDQSVYSSNITNTNSSSLHNSCSSSSSGGNNSLYNENDISKYNIFNNNDNDNLKNLLVPNNNSNNNNNNNNIIIINSNNNNNNNNNNFKRDNESSLNYHTSIMTKEQPAGIINYSTTCYINVVMQCLSVFFKLIYTLHNYVTVKYKNVNMSSDENENMNSSFINKNFFTNSIPFNIFGSNNNNNKKKDECLLLTFSFKLFQLSKMHNKGKVLCVNKLLNLLNDKYSYLFEYNEQQDCHEFLLLVFDFIHNMVKVIDESVDKNNQIDYYLKKEQSIISDLFLGLIEEKITCSQCEYVNYIYQPVYNLSVNVFKKNPENNINDNLIEYFKKEEVNSTCEKCKCKKMFKYSCVYKQPNILIIHLIRLQEDGSKIDKPIKFDMADFTIENVLKKKDNQFIEPIKKYNLCGVIVHRGLNSNCGHYICYTKRKHSNGVNVVRKKINNNIKMNTYIYNIFFVHSDILSIYIYIYIYIHIIFMFSFFIHYSGTNLMIAR